MNNGIAMAFTHEDGWLDGPYFVVHPNYQKLNEENLEQIKKNFHKNREIENARRNGWL